MAETTLKIVRRLGDNFTIIANEFARDPEVTPRAARLFIYLASHSTGWKLSVTATMNATGMGRGTVFKALNDLRALGYVKRYQAVDENDRFAGTEYQIFDLPLPEHQRDDVAASSDPRVPKSDTRDELGVSGETAGNPRVPKSGIRENGIRKSDTLKKNKPKEEQPQVDQEEHHAQGELALPVQTVADDFTEWWAAYPRKTAKKAAERAYKAARRGGATRETLLAGVERSVRSWQVEGRPKDKYPYPATWLNQGRWEDEETTAQDVYERPVRRQPTANDVAQQMIQRMRQDPAGGGWKELGQ